MEKFAPEPRYRVSALTRTLAVGDAMEKLCLGFLALFPASVGFLTSPSHCITKGYGI
jgi:hypothetical protein